MLPITSHHQYTTTTSTRFFFFCFPPNVQSPLNSGRAPNKILSIPRTNTTQLIPQDIFFFSTQFRSPKFGSRSPEPILECHSQHDFLHTQDQHSTTNSTIYLYFFHPKSGSHSPEPIPGCCSQQDFLHTYGSNHLSPQPTCIQT